MKSTLLAVALLFAGCAFKVGSSNGPGGGKHDMSMAASSTDMTGGGGTGGTGGGGGTGGTGGSGGGGGGDMASSDMGPVCVATSKQCDASGNVETCRADGSGFDVTTCTFGCAGTGASTHCKVLTPTAPVTSADYQYVGLSAKTLSAVGGSNNNYVFDTNDGTINGPNGQTVRHANSGPDVTTAQVKDNIGFRRTGNVAIWAFATLDVPTGVSVGFKQSGSAIGGASQYGVAFVSQGAMTIEGGIDLRGYKGGYQTNDNTNTNNLCSDNTPGPAGGIGGTTTTSGGNAAGAGAGKPGTGTLAGGGGGSYGGTGSAGGSTGGAAGSAYTTLSAAAGGSGGGGGASPPMGALGYGTSEAPGGGGGGAMQFVAVGSITISGVINAGGCGGKGSDGRGGGGGGSGGALLFESPSIHVSGSVAANGGGGGAGGDFVDVSAGGPGEPGQDGTTVALGGTNAQAVAGSGGSGGVAVSNNGGAAKDGTSNNGSTGGGGGGGGGTGRIRFNVQAPANFVADNGSQISPATTDGAGGVGALSFQ